jgi:hypothetical protein
MAACSTASIEADAADARVQVDAVDVAADVGQPEVVDVGQLVDVADVNNGAD